MLTGALFARNKFDDVPTTQDSQLVMATAAPVQQFVSNSVFEPGPAKPVDQHVPGSAFTADAETEKSAKRPAGSSFTAPEG